MNDDVKRVHPNEPYCNHCGYLLTGLTESSKCPECGRPLVEVLTRKQMFPVGKRYRSKLHIFGWPLVCIATGPGPEGLRGVARGIIAIGDVAIGGFACGGMAFGIIAFGGFALGITTLGGLSIGLLAAMGGAAVGALAQGGGALGVIAQGGGAVGIIADGGGAVGYIVRAGPSQTNAFTEWHWLLGSTPGGMMLSLWILGLILAIAAIGSAVLLIGWLTTDCKADHQ